METNKYKVIFDAEYKNDKENNGCPPENKLQFLGSSIFNFTTYDNSVDELFASKMLEVIECILNRTTFEYQKEEAQYLNYLTMVNMPFLKNKIEWGTSVRGAWFEEYQEYSFGYDNIIPKEELGIFMKAILEWIRE